MLHHTYNSLTISLLSIFIFGSQPIFTPDINAQENKTEAHFDPAKGFKPAQTSLTDIFLQLAESLEHYGTPEPYMRHMKDEHRRIEAIYGKKMENKFKSYCPKHITDSYLDGTAKNWGKLAPKIGLEKLTKDSGRKMRIAINAENGGGTVMILILNYHARLVHDEIIESGNRKIGFVQLESEILRMMKEGEVPFIVKRETKLNNAEKEEFRSFLKTARFTKSDFSAMDKFYSDSGPYDKLTEFGKNQMSLRTFAGTRPASEAPSIDSDGRKYALQFWKEFETLYEKIDSKASPELAAHIKKYLNGVISDVGQMAHSEFTISVIETLLDDAKSP